jgi:hypothetical protein
MGVLGIVVLCIKNIGSNLLTKRGFPKLFLFCKKKSFMKILLRTILPLLFILPLNLHAQYFSPFLDLSDTIQVHTLETRRGDVFVGRVIEIIDTRLNFLAEGNIPIEFTFSEIKRVSVNGLDEYEPIEEHSSRNRRKEYDSVKDTFPIQIMFYTSTAFSLEKDRRLYTNADLLWNSIDFAITDNFSAGVGAFLPIVAIVRGKYAYDISEKVHIGAGTNLFTVFYDFDDLEMLSHVYGVATFGTPKLFVNVTAGYFMPVGFIEDRFIGTSAGFGGESDKFVYKAELFIWRNRSFNGEYITSIHPEIAFGWKLRNKRFEIGVIGLPETDITLFPYLAFKTHF